MRKHGVSTNECTREWWTDAEGKRDSHSLCPHPFYTAQLTGRKVAIKKVGDTFCDLVDAKRILREIKLLRVRVCVERGVHCPLFHPPTHPSPCLPTALHRA